MNNNEVKQLKIWIHEELQLIRDEVKKIDDKLDNHLVSVATNIAEIKTDMGWLKKFFWLVTSISVSAILIAFFSVILK